MTVLQASELVQQAVMLGMIQYRSIMDPGTDRMKQREAWRYIESQGFQRKALSEWVEAGLVHRRKDETRGGNSPVWYKVSEIQGAIVAVRTSEAMEEY
ncbi:MAG: hypothetical protein IKH15_06765 [Bacteroidales bacterium]|nr:hypothetical protein [Bacteroidales bacterium]MBR7051630.1 hypothetical protein [Bacteroidaceae bacterium]